VPSHQEKVEQESEGGDDGQGCRRDDFPSFSKSSNDTTDKDRLDDANDGNAVSHRPDIETIVEVGIRPLRPENRDNDPLGKLKIEPEEQETKEHNASERPRCDAESGAGEMSNSLRALAPVPATGGSDSRLRDDVKEFFMEVAKDGFRLGGRSEQNDKPCS